MSQRLYLVAIIAVVTTVLVMQVYKTPPTPEQRAEQTSSTAVFGGVSLRVEYATTSAARERGLGGRGSIPDDHGMLFVFPKDAYYGFWMKDTVIPLDIFWLDDKGQVISIVEKVATSSYPHVFYPDSPARYVLETAAGFAAAHAVATGTQLILKKFPIVTE